MHGKFCQFFTNKNDNENQHHYRGICFFWEGYFIHSFFEEKMTKINFGGFEKNNFCMWLELYWFRPLFGCFLGFLFTKINAPPMEKTNIFTKFYLHIVKVTSGIFKHFLRQLSATFNQIIIIWWKITIHVI